MKASLENYNAPKVDANYEVVLITNDFQRVLKNPSIPSGSIFLTGSLAYQDQPGRPMLEAVLLKGELNSRRLNFKSGNIRADAEDIGLHYRLASGNAQVDNIHARLLGGLLTGRLSVQDLSRTSQGRLQASLKGISLAQLKSVSPSGKQVNVRGRKSVV